MVQRQGNNLEQEITMRKVVRDMRLGRRKLRSENVRLVGYLVGSGGKI